MESLTQEQQTLLNKHARDYRDIILNCSKHPPTGDLEAGIHNLYKNAGLQPPRHIIVASSYREEKMIIQYILKNGGDAEQVGKQIRDYETGQINDVVHKELFAKTNEDVREVVGRALSVCGIGEQWLTIKTQSVKDLPQEDMGHKVPEGLLSSRKKKGSDNNTVIEHNFGLQWAYWLSRFMFWHDIGLLDNKKFKEHWIDYIFANRIWSAQYFKTWAIVTRMPKKISLNGRRRLHSVDGPAVEWEDNKYNNLYFIHGIVFEKGLWERVVSQTISSQEILGLQNMEQRQAVLAVVSPELLLKDVQHQLMDEKPPIIRNAEKYSAEWKALKYKPIKLYKINGHDLIQNMRDDIYVLTYYDPSTGRNYFSFVQPDRTKSAYDAMASKFGLSEKEYIEQVVIET